MRRRKAWIRAEKARGLITCGLLLPGLLLPSAAFPAPAAPTMDDVRHEGEPGRALLVVTRQDREHRAGHIPGLVHFPCEPALTSRLRAARHA